MNLGRCEFRWITVLFICSVAGILQAVGVLASESKEMGGIARIPVGVAKVDITPLGPVRMYGYASRTTESEGIAGRLSAKALAIGADTGEGPAILLTVDCGAVPKELRSEVQERLRAQMRIKSERFVLCNTHTHAGPNVKGAKSLPAEERDRLLHYGRELANRLVEVVLQALGNRQAADLAWGQGIVPFAANRRVLKDGKWAGFGAVLDGPVDHGLSLLRITDQKGKLIALVANYACHCTTLRGDFKKIHGDWAGSAQTFIEADHPGAVALICIGCGADADPHPHGTLELAERHGRAVADEVRRLLREPLRPVAPSLTARRAILEVPYEEPSDLGELKERAKTSWSLRELLERIQRGEELPAFEYPITTWVFGEDLAMVFLTGEVVVDYALRLKRELDGRRLWITAYSHDVPCYIVSKRLLGEGGYEVRNSLSSRITFGRPEKATPPLEDRIVDQVRALLPTAFLTPARRRF